MKKQYTDLSGGREGDRGRQTDRESYENRKLLQMWGKNLRKS